MSSGTPSSGTGGLSGPRTTRSPASSTTALQDTGFQIKTITDPFVISFNLALLSELGGDSLVDLDFTPPATLSCSDRWIVNEEVTAISDGHQPDADATTFNIAWSTYNRDLRLLGVTTWTTDSSYAECQPSSALQPLYSPAGCPIGYTIAEIEYFEAPSNSSSATRKIWDVLCCKRYGDSANSCTCMADM